MRTTPTIGSTTSGARTRRSSWLVMVATLLVSLGAAPRAFAQKTPAEHFEAGVSFFEDGDNMAAMVEFKKAYEMSGKWQVLYNLGQTSRALRQYAEALKWFRRYQAEGGEAIAPARREDIRRYITELEKRVGSIQLESNVSGAEVTVDDIFVAKTPVAEPILVGAGRRKIIMTKPGYSSVTRLVDIAARETLSLRLDMASLEAAPAPPPVVVSPSPAPPPASKRGAQAASAEPRRIGVGTWVLLGVTGAAAVSAGVVGGLAVSSNGDFEDDLERFPTTSDTIDESRDETRRLALVTDVLTGVAVAAGISTAILFALDLGAFDGDEAEVESAARVRPNLSAGLDGSFTAGLRGTF